MSELLDLIFRTGFGPNPATAEYPRLRAVSRVLSGLNTGKFGSENISELINLCAFHARPQVYLEIGTHRGRSLLSAAIFNPRVRCIGIDNFSEFDQGGTVRRELLSNIARTRNIELYLEDYRTALPLIFRDPAFRIGVFFYDGHHSYEDTFNSLELVYPRLSPTAVVLIDDYNWIAPQRAVADFLSRHKDFSLYFSIITPAQYSNWHNGFAVLERAHS